MLWLITKKKKKTEEILETWKSLKEKISNSKTITFEAVSANLKELKKQARKVDKAIFIFSKPSPPGRKRETKNEISTAKLYGINLEDHFKKEGEE